MPKPTLSPLAGRMIHQPPSTRLIPVSGPVQSLPDDWRKDNAQRSLERDRVSPGTRGAR